MSEFVRPLWMKVEGGEPLTRWEAFQWHVVGPICRALARRTIVGRETPELRERCVRYAIDAGAKVGWEVQREAEKIMKFITTGSDRP